MRETCGGTHILHLAKGRVTAVLVLIPRLNRTTS